MEQASKALTAAMNNNTVMNSLLLGAFGLLSFRTLSRQNEIETLEAERDSLVKSNKAMKKSMWDWKQQLYAEAENLQSAAIIPLSKLKLIYGEVVVTPQIRDNALKEDTKSSGSKFVA